jgi:hypothetical protein
MLQECHDDPSPIFNRLNRPTRWIASVDSALP